MSTALILETSTPHGSVAFVDARGEISQRSFSSDRAHNALLFTPLEELLKNQQLRELHCVLVGSGPGSYSGTRVGIAAAQGVAIAASCPVISVPSILALPAGENGERYLVLGDARRGSFWTAQVENSHLHQQPTLTDLAGLEALVNRAVEAGTALVSLENKERFPLPSLRQLQILQQFPTAKNLWHIWENSSRMTQQAWKTKPPQPIYLKPPHITVRNVASVVIGGTA